MIARPSRGRRIYAVGGTIVKSCRLQSGICVSHEFGDLCEVATVSSLKNSSRGYLSRQYTLEGKIGFLFLIEVSS